MDFELSDEQAMLREASREMLTAHAPASALRRQRDNGESVHAGLWRQGRELGWPGLLVSEEYGGVNQGLSEAAIVAEEIGRAIARGPFLPNMVVARAVARSDHARLRAEVLPELAEGEVWATWAVAEPGPFLMAPGTCVAVRSGTGSLDLSGGKTAVQDADGARWLLVSGALDEEPALFLLDTDARGLTIRPQRTLDLSRNFAEVTLDRVRIPAHRVVASGGPAVRELLDDAAVVAAAESLGTLERMLELTVEYVKARVQFGRPIGSFQAVKHACATIAMQLLGVRAATSYAAMATDAGIADASLAASVAASYTTDVAGAIAGSALQLHGGLGFSWEHDLHLYLRRAKTNALLQGGIRTHRTRLAELVRRATVPA